MSGGDEIERCLESFLLRVLLHIEEPSRARIDILSAEIWRCFNSLMQLHNYIPDNKSEGYFITSMDSFDDGFIKAIIDFMDTEQSCKPTIVNALSKYPPFRFFITIGRMVLLHSPNVMLQFWLRVGTVGSSDDWTTGIAVKTSASVEDEKIFLVDSGMLSRLIEEIMSVAYKLERLHLK
uniref:Uncharacterized protein n=1 Tax=Wuchereria bancrofti TaxID=6293 RepID=A0A1I8EYG1_WUCBA